MDDYFFIVNPVAGSGAALRKFAQVEQLLKQKCIRYGKALTTAPQHAAALAKQALARGKTRIIAVGGDGTVGEVASALCNTSATMGILPFGTGNDLARTLCLPTQPEEALGVVLGGDSRQVDAGEANGKFFINEAGFGFDVDVLQCTESFKKRFTGMIPYLLGLVRALSHLRPLHLTIRYGEQTLEQDSLLIAVGNGRFFGGGMQVLPNACPFDGQFDVCVVKHMTLGRFLAILPRFVKGKHIGLPEITYFRTDAVQVDCTTESPLNLDGEVGLNVPVTFRLLPGALRVLLASQA
ncbi:MAG: diacylglycerol kinase family lipid kinase [Christensenellaceae bacterium]|jgi:YegS/Rv2252/BmrU family lipid kinase|nr:diacylglycerol kinase family lipid kinase [Christensenellaceae bacterium]